MAACCRDGEPLPPLKSKITHAEFYCKGKLKASYLNSLSGTMSPHLTESHGGEKLTSSPAVSPAKILAAPGLAKALQDQEAAYGVKWRESFAKWDPDLSSWKTHQYLLLGGWESYSETWPRWGMMLNGLCSARVMPAHPTSAKEYGSWPTPTKREWKGANAPAGLIRKDGKTRMDQLPNAVQYHTGTKTRQNWPTPRCQMTRTTKEDRNKSNLEEKVGQTKTNHLNPSWVEWLMGWPTGWTDLRPLGMDKFQRWLHLHGKS